MSNLLREHQEMLARVEAKARAKEAEIQRKLEEQKTQTSSSWRDGVAARTPARDDGWRAKAAEERPAKEEKKPGDTWRTGMCTEHIIIL